MANRSQHWWGSLYTRFHFVGLTRLECVLALAAIGGLIFALKEESEVDEQRGEEEALKQAREVARKLDFAGGKRAEALDAEALRLQKESGERLPKAGKPWTNSLGLRFVPAGTDGVLVCVYDVRVKDYQQFISATGQKRDDPAFPQTENDPAVCMNWNDAQAFCDWLTKKERAAGLLEPKQSYRLPKDEEWSRAVGSGKYPWGGGYPPPRDAGNYGRNGDWTSYFPWEDDKSTDGYEYTSPVGYFRPNSYGLYDMGGNVWQMCDDWYDFSMMAQYFGPPAERHQYRVLRGASWNTLDTKRLLSTYRYAADPSIGDSGHGFRLVLVVSP